MTTPAPDTETTGFNGLRVAAFESRMAGEMEALITRHGGQALVAPSMREVPLSENKKALRFFETLQQGQIDIVVFMTGVGTRALFEVLEANFAPSRIKQAFKHAALVARGPKSVKALTEKGLKSSVTVPEPNTWREVLETMATFRPLKGQRVAVQEYGVTNTEFMEGLLQQGVSEAMSVPVYKWALPEDPRPLQALLERIIEGDAQVALFTSAQQVRNVFEVAQKMGQSAELNDAFQRLVIGSVGSVCSEALREFGLEPDLEPGHPKMGFLVKETAERSFELCQKKAAQLIQTMDRRPAKTLASPSESSFLKACRREAVDRTPMWIMRQAGRYLPEYREIRSKVPFLELCKTPELAAEVTVTAQQVLDVDAAILFADILLIAEPLGFQLTFGEGEGPVIHNPFRGGQDLARIQNADITYELEYVMRAVRLIRAGLKPHIPLIGFAGAPFTLASYLIEGGGSKDYLKTRAVLTDIKVWDELMKKLVAATVAYLNGQAEAGAQALQLFDSWVGILAPEEFQRLVLPYLKLLFGQLKKLQPSIPLIYFGTQTAPFYPYFRQMGASVFGVDWRMDLDKAWKLLGPFAVQGNLNPEILLTDPDTVRRETEKVLRQAAGQPGHIFNLGHGILPKTPMENVWAMIETVKNWKP
ncbi:MAG TPA: uroporphyrinogen decarboxylase [bacterium]|nr:uroporphyrinogen decarboxylase [bacterium]